MTISFSPKGLPQEDSRDRPHWSQNKSVQKFCGVVVKEQEIEMPTGKQDPSEQSSSDEDTSVRDTLNLPTLEVDDEMGNVQSNLSDVGEDPEERQYGQFEGGGAAARTVYHQRMSDQDTVNSTQSLYDSDITYFMIHGRRYCKDYYMPNDEEEQDRTQMLHEVYLYLFDQQLTTVPLDNPTKILDVGTGTGEWAMAMGDEYPEAEIIGTDIAKIQPGAVPPNVYFEIDDAEEEGGWTWPEDEFDLVHFRTMTGAFRSWEEMYKLTFKHLKPGGWIEVIDFDDHGQILSYFGPDNTIAEWFRAIADATRLSGRPRTSSHLEPEVLEKLGYVDVKQVTRMIPFGNWPTDPLAQAIGKQFLITQLCGVEAICLRPLTEGLGWNPRKVREVCQTIVEKTRDVALDPAKASGMGFHIKCLIGRKSGGPPLENGFA